MKANSGICGTSGCLHLPLVIWCTSSLQIHKVTDVSDSICKPFIPHICASRYFQAGGSPENVIQLLSENYTAVAQTVNLLAEWLIQSGLLMQNVAIDIRNHNAFL